jgi:hypothetical protein
VFGDTGWQDYAAVPAKHLTKMPKMEPMTHLLSVYGIAGLTAYFGLLDVGKPKAGETVVVSAAAGSVGSIVGQIAKIKGCRVVGIAGGKDKCNWLTSELGFDAAVDYKDGAVFKALKAAAPKGIDVYFDNVGGDILEACLAQMNNRGRIACCGAISQYDGVPSAHGPRGVPGLIVVKRLIMQGFIVMDFMDQRDRRCRPAVLGRLRQTESAGRRHQRPGEHAEGADRTVGRRKPRQADDQRCRAYRRDRRRPRRPLFRLSLEAASSGRADRPVRAEPRRRHLGLWRGVLRTGAGIPARRRSRHRRRHRAADGELEEHHAQSARRERRDRRRRLFLDRPARSAGILQQRVRAVGVTPRYDTLIQSVDQLAGYDLIVAADGLNSLVRRSFEGDFGASVSLFANKFAWYGTHKALRDAVADFCETDLGAFNAHHYRYSPDMSTFLVECDARPGSATALPTRPSSNRRRFARSVCRHARRPSAGVEQIGVAQFPVDLERALVVQEYGADRRRAAFGAFLDRLGHAARDRGRIALTKALEAERDHFRSARPLPGRAQADREEAGDGGAHQRRLVRKFPEHMKLGLMDFAYSYITRSGRIDDARLRAMSPAFMARYEASRAAAAQAREQGMRSSRMDHDARSPTRSRPTAPARGDRLCDPASLQRQPHPVRQSGAAAASGLR